MKTFKLVANFVWLALGVVLLLLKATNVPYIANLTWWAVPAVMFFPVTIMALISLVLGFAAFIIATIEGFCKMFSKHYFD